MTTRLSLGTLIHAYRKGAHLTQTELAARVGTSSDRIAHIENGRTRLPADEVPTFAQALGCAVSDLLQQPQEAPM